MNYLTQLSKSAKEKVLACQLEWSPDPVHEARLYQTALLEHGVTQQLLAKATGRKRSYIANVVRILNLPKAVQKLVSQQKLSISQARIILKALPEMQTRLAKECVINQWTVRELQANTASARPYESEVKQAAENLHKEKGLISRISTNSNGNCFVQFAFRSPAEARAFLRKVEKL